MTPTEKRQYKQLQLHKPLLKAYPDHQFHVYVLRDQEAFEAYLDTEADEVRLKTAPTPAHLFLDPCLVS